MCSRRVCSTTWNSARRFYFAYCEAAFDAKYIHDYHILWVKDAAATTALASQPLPSSAALTSSPTQPITQVIQCSLLPGFAVVRWTTAYYYSMSHTTYQTDLCSDCITINSQGWQSRCSNAYPTCIHHLLSSDSQCTSYLLWVRNAELHTEQLGCH